MAGVVGWWSVLVPVGLTVGFLMVSAAAARQERRQVDEHRSMDAPSARRVPDDRQRADDRREMPSPRTVSRHAAPAVTRNVGEDRIRDVPVETPTITVAAYEPPVPSAFSTPSTPSVPSAPAAETAPPVASDRVSLGPSVPSGELWDPVRVPLPTYVTKAKAPRTVRTVDLAQSGVWAAGGTSADGLLTRPGDAPKMLLDESGADDRSGAERGSANGEQKSGDTDWRAVGD
ncbi:hypothetical protein SAMN05421678_102336 [Actinopolymorpha cephalotaxi]|nr:hypothetical protein SAMN05421678_102336 [Actinopolymorpha cephalotaxi]